MHHFFDTITNTSGDSLVGRYARVIDPATLETVTLSSDNNGTPIITVSGVADMAVTDDYGNLSFYVEPGTYHLDIYEQDTTTFVFRVSNVAMNSTKGDKGDAGDTGPAGTSDNTYTPDNGGLAAFKASDITRATASLVGVPNIADGRFNWTPGDFTGQADDVSIVKADSTALTVGAWVRQQAEGIAYGRSNILLPLDQSIPRTLAYMAGVDQFTTSSQQSKLENAFADAAGDGLKLEAHPDANYRHDGPLPIGTSFDGKGAAFTALSDGFNSLTLSGDGVVFRNFRHRGGASQRAPNGDNRYNGLTGVGLSNFYIENVAIGSAGVNGSGVELGFASAGALFTGCTDGVVIGLRTANSKADAIHNTGGTSRVSFYGPIVRVAGDDGFAVVDYADASNNCEQIRLYGGEFFQCHARGVSFVGGRDLLAVGPAIIESSAAGVYMAQESGFYNTKPVLRSHIRGFTARNCVTGAFLPEGFSNGVALMTGGAVEDCSMWGDIAGVGIRANAGIVTTSGVKRASFKVNMRDVTGPLNPAAVLAGGQSIEGEYSVQNCGGPALVLLANTASGVHRHRFLDSDGIRTQANPIEAVVYTETNPSLEELHFEGTFRNAPGNLTIDVGGAAGRTKYENVRLNGAAVSGKNYDVGTVSYSNGWSAKAGQELRVVREPNGLVVGAGAAVGGTIDPGTQIGVLPAGFRPFIRHDVSAVNSDGTIGVIAIFSGGQIVAVSGVTADTQINFTFAGM